MKCRSWKIIFFKKGYSNDTLVTQNYRVLDQPALHLHIFDLPWSMLDTQASTCTGLERGRRWRNHFSSCASAMLLLLRPVGWQERFRHSFEIWVVLEFTLYTKLLRLRSVPLPHPGDHLNPRFLCRVYFGYDSGPRATHPTRRPWIPGHRVVHTL